MRHSELVYLCLQAKDLHDSLRGTIIQRLQPDYLVAALNSRQNRPNINQALTLCEVIELM